MTTEEIFKYGVTPKEGAEKGKRFYVKSITADGIECDGKRTFKHDECELWREPATLFEDCNIPSTWGNLKKAVESKGLSDDTPILTNDYAFFKTRATFGLGRINGKPYIFVG